MSGEAEPLEGNRTSVEAGHCSGRRGDFTGRKNDLYCMMRIPPLKLMVKMVSRFVGLAYNEEDLH